MSGVLQGSWGIGFLLSSAVYGLLFNTIGWRGCLWIGVLPALTVVYVRYFVKEPPVWVEDRRIQRTQNREVRMPLLSIFKRGMISNTALACWWMAGGLVTYYSINGMFATHLQKDLGLSPALIATPIVVANAGRIPGKHVLGLGRRPYWQALGDDYPRPIGHARSDAGEDREIERRRCVSIKDRSRPPGVSSPTAHRLASSARR
jgi:SHS family lactate transporter-like MFS transporter